MTTPFDTHDAETRRMAAAIAKATSEVDPDRFPLDIEDFRATVSISEVVIGDRTWSRNGPGDLITSTEATPNGDEMDYVVVTDRGVISGGESVVVSLWREPPSGDDARRGANEMRSRAFADPLQRLEAAPPYSGWLRPIATHLGHPPADHPGNTWSDERQYGIPAAYTPRRGR